MIPSKDWSEKGALFVAKRDITGAVDFPYLESYAAGDEALIAEVLSMFEEQVELWLRLLDPAGDAAAWRDGAHTLKGASAGVGAKALAEVCAEAERAASETPGFKTAVLNRVRGALDLVLADIAAYRHEGALKSLRS
jgi:HPt (histidine-containing phosphotransfer) domain-containing protein